MTNLFTCLSKKSLSSDNGSMMDRQCTGAKSALPKKFTVLLCLLFTVGIGNVWGTTVTYTFTAKNWTATSGGSAANWTSNTDGASFETRGVQNTSSSKGSCTSPTSFSGVVSISIVASSNTTVGTIQVKIGTTEIATKSIANSTDATYTYDATDKSDITSLSGNIRINTSTTDKSVYVKSVTITYVTETFTVTYDAGSGTCGTASKTQESLGETITLPSASPDSYCSAEGWVFAGWATSSCTETANKPTLYTAGSSYVPLTTHNLYAVYRLGDVYAVDFESATSAYTDWTFTNATSAQSGSVTAHGGSKYGTTGGNSTASIVTNSKLASPKSIRFYVTKQTDNTTESTWYVQTSTDGSSWTDRKTQNAASVTKGTWTEVTQDLSSYSDVYVRVYYSGSTAVRDIDDLELSCAIYNSNPDCIYDYFVDIMHDNTTIEKQGSYSMPAALSDADKGSTYCDEKHFHFLGWVEESYINDDGTLKDGYTLYPAGDSGHTANNKTYYAIWGKEE